MAAEQNRLDVPKHLQYSQDHVWIDDSVEPAILGITEYAAEQMGEIVFVDLPQVDTQVQAGDVLLELESSKAVEQVISPVSGTITYVNREVEDDGAIINDDPYGEGWLVKIELDNDEPELMDAEEYEQMTK